MTKVIFLGTDKRAISVLENLLEKHEVVGVITQPDKVRGKDTEPSPTFIAKFAEDKNIPVLKPENLDESAVIWIRDKDPEVLVTAYFAQLIPPELLNLTPAGILVIHPSLLPRWRWGSPVQATMAAGDKETGVTIMKMDEKFDHGPIIAQVKEPILETDNQESLYIRLFEKGALLLNEVLEDYIKQTLQPVEQDHSNATFARHLQKGHGFIPGEYLEDALNGKVTDGMLLVPFALDSDKDEIVLPPTPENLFNLIRAVTPWPGAFTRVKVKGESEKILKILEAHIEGEKLVLDRVQLEGKKPVTWRQFREGYPDFKLSN